MMGSNPSYLIKYFLLYYVYSKIHETFVMNYFFSSFCRGGANGCGGLASVRMELILLLQELQQEKTQKQLLSPLPFPTTLPLLSACIAQQKTVIADPVRHLHNLTHDMLITITGNIIQSLKLIKFIYLEKATKFCEIFTLFLTDTT